MRFGSPFVTQALLGSAALAASIPGRSNRPAGRFERQQANQHGLPVHQIEEEIAHLEQELEQELHEIEQLSHEHGSYGSHAQPSSSSSSGPAASSTPVTSAVLPSGSAATASSSTLLSTSASSAADVPGYSSISSQASAAASSFASSSSTSSVLSSSTDVAATTLASASPLASSVNDTLSSLTAAYGSVASVYPVASSNATLSSLLAAASSFVASVDSSNASTSTASVDATSYVASASPIASAGSYLLTAASSSVASISPVKVANQSRSSFPTAAVSGSSLASASFSGSSAAVSSKPFGFANSTSAFLTGTGTAASMAPTTTVSADTTTAAYCSSLCDSLTFSSDLTVTPVSCQAYSANDTITITGGQATASCGTTIQPELDLCRITLNIATSDSSTTYMEVWLPNGNETAWNGRTMSTDNGGLNGCVAFDDMQYVSGLGFAAIGDNGGHDSGAFDGSWMSNKETILDWVYRARHESVVAGKDVVNQFYGKSADKSYYIGCSTGGQQGLHSAQYFPDDFDGIIAGSAAADFEHLEDWSSRFIQLTGTSTDDERFLTEDQWILVQSYIFDQCDEALDGVNDGILEDPTICQFNASVMVCADNSTDNCLTATQVNTVEQVFTELYNTDGELLYPQLLYGSQVDAYRLGQLSGSIQGIAHDWFAYGVYNNSDFDAMTIDQDDYAEADSLDAYYGHPSSFNGDLSAFNAAGHKLLMYHGMADPLVSGANSQRYYLKVAKTLGLTNTDLDDFLRLFRVSGMAHCGVGGISGAGAWMFGQTGDAAVDGTADNIVWNLVDWVENGNAPDTITGTKFWYDTPSLGVEFYRPHCRFPYRTTYEGGDYTEADSWGCTFIDDWQDCGVGAHPRLCNVDGSFTL